MNNVTNVNNIRGSGERYNYCSRPDITHIIHIVHIVHASTSEDKAGEERVANSSPDKRTEEDS